MVGGWSLVTCRSPDGSDAVAALRADGSVVTVPPLAGHAGLAAVFRAGVDLAAALRGWHPDDGTPLDAPRILAPVRYPEKLLCAGANYGSHLLEMTGSPPPEGAVPWFFCVPPGNTIIGPDEAVLIPGDPAARVDWEAEVAVVVGAPLRDAGRDEASAAIAGYTILNDISARGLSRPAVPLAPAMAIDWVASKARDTFCPMGPGLVPAWLVPPDEPLRIRMWLNGELRQDGSTADMVFDVPALLSALSRTLTLGPGDVVATGTPAGTGVATGRYLADGDVMEIEVEGLGRLRNPVRALP